MTRKKKQSPIIILSAIVLAFIVGNLTGTDSGFFGVTFYSIFDLLGKIFINSLTLIVVPLVASSIILGVAKIGKDESFGRISLKIFAFYFATTLSAILVGLLLVNLLSPGVNDCLRNIAQQGSLTEMQEQMAAQGEGGAARGRPRPARSRGQPAAAGEPDLPDAPAAGPGRARGAAAAHRSRRPRACLLRLPRPVRGHPLVLRPALSGVRRLQPRAAHSGQSWS